MRKILLLLLLPVFSLSYGQGRARLDSLLNLLTNKYSNRQDSGKVRLLYQVADEYAGLVNDSANAYARVGLQLAEQIGDKYGEGLCLFRIGSGVGGYNGNMGNLMQALKLFEQFDDKGHVAMVLDVIAGHYYNMERFDQALIYFERALSENEKIKDEFNAARAKSNLGEAYGKLGNFSKALEYEFPVLQYFEKNGPADRTGITLSNIGNAFLGLKEYNKALVYASAAVRLFNSLHEDSHKLAFALSDMGHIYFIAANDPITRLRPDSLLAANRQENLAKAIHYYTEAHHVYERNPHFIPTNIALRLANALAATGRYEEALNYYKEHAASKDSLLSEDNRLKVSAAETRRETDLKDRQITINKVQEAGNIRERWLFGIGLCLLGLVAVLVWRNYVTQKQANKRLGEEKDKADELAANLQESLVQKDALTVQLSHAADMKTRFLANISHELRTPVTLLSGMMEQMKQPGGDKERQLAIAYDNSRRLQHMIEEILDLSRMETVEARMNLGSMEIAPLLKRMVYAFETFIAKEQLLLSYREVAAQGICVSVDEKMLEKVINNLVYNAIKFNEPGGWIKASAFISDDGREFIFMIANSGAGIKSEDLPHVFERYYQGNSTTPKAEGVGIGLSLVHEFTQRMGGTVEVTSSGTLGTAFTLRFPVVSQPAHQLPSTYVADTELPDNVWEQFATAQTILIVEDNEEMRYYLRLVLANKVNLSEACNGKEALDWLKENHADLVITDLMMPEMGGEELIQQMKNTAAWKKIPVITLTALADTKNQLNLLRLGIDDYIVKPFLAEELRTRVYNLLQNQEERRRFENSPAEPDDIPR
jgi:signal transduction histidine kinase/ActR/RegA family two-component response regulator